MQDYLKLAQDQIKDNKPLKKIENTIKKYLESKGEEDITDDMISTKLYDIEGYSEYLKNQKELKKQNLLAYANNSEKLQADLESMLFMNNVVTLGMFEMLQEFVKLDPRLEPLYEKYMEKILEWKNAQNKISKLQIDTIAKILQNAMWDIEKIVKGIEE